MSQEITKNFVFLAENVTNLSKILWYLVQNGIISENEGEDIEAERTTFGKNTKLLRLILKKDWDATRNVFLEILRKTNNDNCANRIEGQATQLLHSKICKWWPDKKQLIKSLYERKIGNKLLVEELHERISTDEKRIVVVCESENAAKYSGMGGMGKTLTAKWYANYYEGNYDHILWIDCGEGSLLQSFKSLARDLEIRNRNELVYLNEFSRKCYEELMKWNCLWIFDNAESYVGDEGIQKILPIEKSSFSCLITSRSRNWGIENVGYGKITDLQLDIFSGEESLDFLKRTLAKEINYTDSLLQELCRFLGNLPLALQLAVAALNTRKVDLKSYMKHNKFEKLIEEKFDDYEKTIFKNVQLSLELILKEENGNVAHQIFLIFGYIRPDDIPVQFFVDTLNLDDEETIKYAVKLLEKYSLVAKRKIENHTFLSIHRLLQQVIRHIGRKTERETLKMVLGGNGLVDYKIIPFTTYADEKLQLEFPRVKSELMDHEKLKNLLKEERFEESIHLAKFIHKELKSRTANFNYSICLEKNGQLEESVKILEKVYRNEKRENGKYSNVLEMGILQLTEGLSKDLIAGHLLVIHRKIGNFNRIQQIIHDGKIFKVIYSKESLNFIIRILNSYSNSINYTLVKKYSFIDLELQGTVKKIELHFCSLKLSAFDRLSTEELQLRNISFIRYEQELEEVKVKDVFELRQLNRLTLDCAYFGKMSFDLGNDDGITIEYLNLRNITIQNWKECKWNVQELILESMSFVQKTKMNIKELEVRRSTLDVSCLPQEIEKLNLIRTKAICCGDIHLPNLKYLQLCEMKTSSLSHFQFVQLTHIYFHWMEKVNVDLIPKSVKQIKFTNNLIVVGGGEKKLDKLILEYISSDKILDILTRITTDNLVIFDYKITLKELVELLKVQMNSFAVGRIDWEQNFHDFSQFVGRKCEFYLFERGKGRGISKEEFDKLQMF